MKKTIPGTGTKSSSGAHQQVMHKPTPKPGVAKPTVRNSVGNPFAPATPDSGGSTNPGSSM